MRILGIETSGSTSSVALLADSAVVSERIFASRRVICQVLAGEILNVLGTETVRQADLDGIVVSIGPGSFTGLRVGVSMAKAMGHACHIPIVGISTPEAWAAEASAPPGTTIAVIQPARVERVYLTTYRVSGSSQLSEQIAPQIVSVDAVGTALAKINKEEPLLLTGDAMGQLLPHYWGRGILAPKSVTTGMAVPQPTEAQDIAEAPRASTVARLGTERLAEADAQSYFTLRPSYIAVSQAERTQGVNLGL